MTKSQKIKSIIDGIQNISYNNENGGAYAYVKFLASARVLLQALKPYKQFEKQIEKIEAINWLFNEYLAVRFTNSQKVIFENKQLELKEVFETIAEGLKVKGMVAEESFIKHYAVAA